jgi:hypothetical protein
VRLGHHLQSRRPWRRRVVRRSRPVRRCRPVRR